MHPLHHRSRRALCILAFWGLGVLPLGLVLTWCMWRHRPGRVAEEAESLGQQLGLTVTIQAVHDLRPGATRYEGVRLIHPETGRSVFFASSLETGWEPATDSTKRPVEALNITLSSGELGVEGLDELERLIQRVMEGRAGCHDPQVRLRAQEVQLHAGQRVQKFVEVQALVDSVPDGVQTVVYFHLADVVMPTPAKIRFLRNRGTTPPSAGFEFSSGDTPLPCELLLPGLPQLARLGRQCKFQGSIAGDQFSGPWQGRVAGQFSDVDCESLLADYPPQRLSGAGQLLVDARFREGRLEMASGDLRAGPGTISQSLLDAAAHCFGLSRGPKPQLDPAPYEQLALAFTFSEQGINVQGRCPVSGPPAAILVDRSTRMLGEPAAKSIPTIALVQLLVPPGEAQVSVSRSCEQILRWLPIPEAVDGGRWPADGGEPTVGSRPPAAVSRQ